MKEKDLCIQYIFHTDDCIHGTNGIFPYAHSNIYHKNQPFMDRSIYHTFGWYGIGYFLGSCAQLLAQRLLTSGDAVQVIFGGFRGGLGGVAKRLEKLHQGDLKRNQ